MPWLLLLHQLPPKPPYLRAKVLRRLNQLGALAIKNSAYVLPESSDTIEDFQWLLRQICEDGGEAWLFRTQALEGHSDESLREAFRALRAPDYAQLGEDARGRLDRLAANGADPGMAADVRRLDRRLAQLRRIDFFEAPGRPEVETLLGELQRRLCEDQPVPPSGESTMALEDMRGRTWVTRAGVKIDRLASAWFIRRFVDPAARFRFVDPEAYQQAAGHLRFDMFQGEFTHEGNRCTFEVLLRRFGAEDRGLQAIGEVVHDIDLKDERFGRPETAGLAQMIEGVILEHADDGKRIEAATPLFDALYARLSAG